jgi:hypothetical protein
MALLGVETGGWLQQPGAEGDRLYVCSARILDVEVEVHLLL